MASRKRQYECNQDYQITEEHQQNNASNVYSILSSFFSGKNPVNVPIYSHCWTGEGAGKKDFKCFDFRSLIKPILVVREASPLSECATIGALRLAFPLHGIKCQNEEDGVLKKKNCSAQRARYYTKHPGLARRLFCCAHIPFNVAIWWMAAPRKKNEHKEGPPPDVLLIECLPKTIVSPEPVLNSPRREVEHLTTRIADMDAAENVISAEFHKIVRQDNVSRLQIWIEVYGVQNVAQVDMYQYGFSLLHEAIRFYKPAIFYYLISLSDENQERIFVHRGKRANDSSPLHLAAYNARLDMVMALHDAGADVFRRTTGNFLPVQVLCQAIARNGYTRQHYMVLDYLMHHMQEKDPQQTLVAQQCPVEKKAYCDTRPIVEWLLRN